jgi:hypothetical protein
VIIGNFYVMIGNNSGMICSGVDTDLWIGSGNYSLEISCFSWIKGSFAVRICIFQTKFFWFYNKLCIKS